MHAGLDGEPRPLREQPCMQACRLTVRYGPASARQGGVNACMHAHNAEQRPPDVGASVHECMPSVAAECMHACMQVRSHAGLS